MLRWYLALLAIGAAGVLPAAALFGRLGSGGVLYARPLALFAIAYLAWVASNLGAAPYGTPLVAGATLAFAAAGVALAWWRPALRGVWRARWRRLLAGEALFLGLLVLIAFARTHAPGAIYTEKPMDLMLLTAVHRAERLPPPDAWLAGERVNYYHLGHTAVDVVGRLAGLGPAIAFNLGVATAGAAAGVVAVALAGDVQALSPRRRRASGAVAGAVALVGLLWLAPLHGVLELLAANGVGASETWESLGVEGFPGRAGAVDLVPRDALWWWRATRVVPGTIAEFPAFSLLLGDLHAHLLALPLSLVTAALAVAAFAGGTPLTWRRWLAAPEALVLVGVLFAALLTTNSWDVVTFGALWAGAAALAFARVGWPPALAVVGAVRYLALPAGAALLLAAPFLASLDRPPLGAALVVGERSDPVRFLLVWLTPWLPLAAGALALRRGGGFAPGRWAFVVAIIVAGAALAVWMLALIAAGEAREIADRGAAWVTLGGLALAFALLAAAAAGAERRRDLALAGWAALAAGAVALVAATELVHIADAFAGRLNTVFKFWFHAWALAAVAGGAAVGTAFDRARWGGRRVRAGRALAWVGVGAAVLVTAAALLYAPAMAVSRAREGQARGLNALAEIRQRDRGLADAAAWARAALDPRRHTLLQAPSASYSTGGALAAASAVPTLLAWPNHERQWRGSRAAIAERTAVVDRIYAEGASPATAELARGWGVTHVYLGREERARYGVDVDARFAAWETVFAGGGARVVAVPAPEAVAR